MWFSRQTKVQWNDLFVSFYAEQKNACEKSTTFKMYMNTCWVPHLEMSPKCLTVASIALSSLHLRSHRIQLWTSDCCFTQHFLNIYQSRYITVWLLHGWCHVKLLPSWRKFYVHHTAMHQFTVTLFKATYMHAACLFSWNLLPALLAEWLGSFIYMLLQ